MMLEAGVLPLDPAVTPALQAWAATFWTGPTPGR